LLYEPTSETSSIEGCILWLRIEQFYCKKVLTKLVGSSKHWMYKFLKILGAFQETMSFS
jgi:hypothetical protein